jgi:uncharacterized protein YjbI with pentapeptide repeats
MHKLALILISAVSLASSSAFAASYQRADGTIVDPIQCGAGCVGDHPYSGNNLEPGANLSGANLTYAVLYAADLRGANLNGADLTGADLNLADLNVAALNLAALTGANLNGALLTGADLTGADLTSANLNEAVLYGADLTGADLTGAILANASWLGSITGSPFYNATTDFTGASTDNGVTPFDPVAAGWTLVPVPEPSTALLIGLGLASLAKRVSRN